ncbi:MAG: 3-dehydroquinate synthase [Thermoflavifilum sp.]|nr:3-dehydroquinate synthase [Thermoflavifilum sp.]MCL6513959.1 3-dehydroquinate synthase [Alicyclobacillus sp.]
MTTVLRVQSQLGGYDVHIGPGVRRRLPDVLEATGIQPDARVLVVTDDTVRSLGHADHVAHVLTAAGWHAELASVAPGDQSKSLAQAERLYNALLDAGVRRDGVIVAVGGGMVGDLAGFVAATYLRGIRWVQVPTTLLAHDSSIGGKVGVNLPRGKNLVGAFYPPRAVLYDTDTLVTLPPREWRGGMAEVIKHGIIGDPELFSILEQCPLPEPPQDSRVVTFMLERAVAVKVRIVEADERESGIRMWLNLGHTLGHAVELLTHYTLNHGEAVSIGLALEARLAVQRGLLPAQDAQRIVDVLDAHLLPTRPPALPWEDVARAIQVDKKHRGTGWTFVLPRAIGQVETVRDMTPEEVAAMWEAATTGEEAE